MGYMGWGRISIRQDDRLFSIFVRKLRGWKCEKCGTYFENGHGLQASHFYGRRKETTRFDLENVHCLCISDHQYFEENPNEYVSWVKERMSEKDFHNLRIRAHLTGKKDVKKNILAIRLDAKKNGIVL